mmetsp:Transcript_104423/g.302091  ORF Transcript_104423/g.302091 Transcript_104423/m.302091 type:complete len:213 (-) Transcript_104423:102-740(-)
MSKRLCSASRYSSSSWSCRRLPSCSSLCCSISRCACLAARSFIRGLICIDGALLCGNTRGVRLGSSSASDSLGGGGMPSMSTQVSSEADVYNLERFSKSSDVGQPLDQTASSGASPPREAGRVVPAASRPSGRAAAGRQASLPKNSMSLKAPAVTEGLGRVALISESASPQQFLVHIHGCAELTAPIAPSCPSLLRPPLPCRRHTTLEQGGG